MKFLRQFMIILLLSFLGEVLKMFIPIANSGKCVWTGVNVGMSGDWYFEDESS